MHILSMVVVNSPDEQLALFTRWSKQEAQSTVRIGLLAHFRGLYLWARLYSPKVLQFPKTPWVQTTGKSVSYLHTSHLQRTAVQIPDIPEMQAWETGIGITNCKRNTEKHRSHVCAFSCNSNNHDNNSLCLHWALPDRKPFPLSFHNYLQIRQIVPSRFTEQEMDVPRG